MEVEKFQLDVLKEKCPKLRSAVVTEEMGFPDLGSKFVLSEFTKRVGDKKLIEDIRVVTGELVTNAEYHGNQFNKNKKVTIYCGWIGKDFYGAIQDEGKGFDINNLSYRVGSPEGGMGIDLSRMRVDLLYNFGNTVFFVKRIT